MSKTLRIVCNNTNVYDIKDVSDGIELHEITAHIIDIECKQERPNYVRFVLTEKNKTVVFKYPNTTLPKIFQNWFPYKYIYTYNIGTYDELDKQDLL